jgi:hypothetical protein
MPAQVMKNHARLFVLLAAAAQIPACYSLSPSVELGDPDFLCELLEDETLKSTEGPVVDVLCVRHGPGGWQDVPPPVAASVEALEEAAAICNDGCSVWMHRACEDLIEDTGYGPIPSCSIAVDCRVRWVKVGVCQYRIFEE